MGAAVNGPTRSFGAERAIEETAQRFGDVDVACHERSHG
jgi:hypothetical protein